MTLGRVRAREAASPVGDLARKGEVLDISPFGALTADAREALLELSRLERCPRRTRLYTQGDASRALWLLGAGRVRLERQRGDRALVIGHRGPGETLGEHVAVNGVGATETAVVVDEVHALVLPAPALRKLLAGSGPLRVAMAAALVERYRAAQDRLESLLLHGVEARLMSFLLAAARRWQARHPKGELVGASFTHADIAMLIGSTRETVTLLLGRLRKAGLIDFERRRIVICDRDALERRVAAS
jgi:CRP-like cAMP-binding protein